jgi:N4-(beta-N-acetylglucosaminyl)-L-asparaginase
MMMGGALASGCAAGAAGAVPVPTSGGWTPTAEPTPLQSRQRVRRRVIVSTWPMGARANDVAWGRCLAGVEHPIEACEAGVAIIEADPSVSSVGIGGRPNAEGVVELDAAIMRGDDLACGSVAGLQRILHPVSVARAVMEQTPHVLLVGEGALTFARRQGFSEQDLLTDEARQSWERWRERQDRPPADDDHDTIGMIVLDEGRFGMAVTTSGWGYKLPGRVGDSPIIGAGGYCDDEAGACVATGDGEQMIRSCASFAVVDAMRRGASPEQALDDVLRRIRRRTTGNPSVSLLAVDRAGRVAGRALKDHFDYALTDDADGTRVLRAEVPS